MFTKWTKKEAGRFLLCFVVMVVLVLLTELPGFLSPFYWSVFSVGSAFVAVGPIAYVMNMKKGFGSSAVLILLWLIINRCAGEMGMPVMWAWIIALAVIVEVLRKLIGYDSIRSIRICAPIAALAPFAPIVPLYFSKAKFLALALEEMSEEYVAVLDKYGTLTRGIIVLALMLIVGAVGERLTERIAKF